MRKTVAFLLLISLAGNGLCSDGDWPHYRGPNRDGIVPVKNLLQGKSFGFETDWIRDLGSGYSSVAVVGDTGVTMFSNGSSDVVMAFDAASGKEKWHYDLGPVYKGHSGSRDGPTSTPTLHDGIVYAIDPHGTFVALSLEKGEKLWAHHLGKDVTARVPHYGFNTVPTVVGDAVIVMTGAKPDHAFTAFDRKSGKPLWNSGNDTTTYQSPFIWKREGKQHILALTDHFLMELDPKDGRVLWQQEHTILDNESFTPPVMMGTNKLVIMHRHMMGGYELSWSGGVATMKELWRLPKYPQTYSIPVYYQDHLYFLRGQFLTCLNAENGEEVWKSRPPGGRALTLMDGHLIIVANSGELTAVEATSEGYREKARFKVFSEESYTPISFAHGHIFMRNLKQMARVKIVDRAKD